MSLLLRRSNGYSKLDKEDPDEMLHRRAKFLIYKTLQQADMPRKKVSFLSIRLRKMRVKIGKRLRKLRKSVVLTISAAKAGTCKRVMSHIKSWKYFLSRPETQHCQHVFFAPIKRAW